MQEPSAAPDPRYPIGRFEWPERVSAADRQGWIEQLEAAPGALRGAIAGLSADELDTAYRPGGWTVRQVVHHLPDSHLNSYIRFRLALTEDEPVIKPYQENLWAELPDARTAPVEPSLELLDALHARWTRLLRAMTDADFARTFRHPEIGLVRLDRNLGLYAWHGRHHVAQITSLRARMERQS